MANSAFPAARGPFEAAFAAQLDWAMKQANMTAAQLAKAISVSSTAMSNYTQGKHLPRPDSQEKLEAVLGVSFVRDDPKVFVPKVNGAPRQDKLALPLTIAEAKAGLALHYGVPPEAISITIQG